MKSLLHLRKPDKLQHQRNRQNLKEIETKRKRLTSVNSKLLLKLSKGDSFDSSFSRSTSIFTLASSRQCSQDVNSSSDLDENQTKEDGAGKEMKHRLWTTNQDPQAGLKNRRNRVLKRARAVQDDTEKTTNITIVFHKADDN